MGCISTVWQLLDRVSNLHQPSIQFKLSLFIVTLYLLIALVHTSHIQLTQKCHISQTPLKFQFTATVNEDQRLGNRTYNVIVLSVK